MMGAAGIWFWFLVWGFGFDRGEGGGILNLELEGF